MVPEGGGGGGEGGATVEVEVVWWAKVSEGQVASVDELYLSSN